VAVWAPSDLGNSVHPTWAASVCETEEDPRLDSTDIVYLSESRTRLPYIVPYIKWRRTRRARKKKRE
jgi:hypothetical protein